MELIREIGNRQELKYKKRTAVMTILQNEKDEIAMLYVGKLNYHKLPGGKIESDENELEALRREILEEVGADIDVISDVGYTMEYRNEFKLMQLSYIYFSKTNGELKEPKYTLREQRLEFSLNWVSLDDAINKLEEEIKEGYFGDSGDEKVARYIVERDLSILKRYKEKRR
ncbi:MAG TPA: ADP-ribose pyrophosphatase [Clostridiales bacterium]|nr:MAG: hypothetical protein A2Y18_03480 [Clostridiales bacterium GWD2_32_19]HCC08113.1 ADP-ribose pyrophosphatase [Clostridiales bacterium]